MKTLTLKQSKFIKEYLNNGGNKVQAALEVYETTSYKTASKIADTNFKNTFIQNEIERSLAKQEISADKIAQVIAKGLKAKKILFDQSTNQLIQSNFSDFNVQHKFLKLVIDILGLNKTTRNEPFPINFISAEQIAEVRQRLNI